MAPISSTTTPSTTTPSTRPTRRLAGLLGTLLLAVLVPLSLAAPAHAADGYRYWNYFHVTAGKYAFAQTGPADFTPKDGTVEAFRYGLSSAADGLKPRTDPTTYTVDSLCVGKKAAAGEKRVGVLIDYGTSADAGSGEKPAEPRGACAVVPTAANGQQVLDAVADVRIEGGLTCGIDGYPVKGCSVTVKNPPAAAAETTVDFSVPKAETSAASDSTQKSDDGGAPWALIGVVALVAVIGAAGLALARRNKTA